MSREITVFTIAMDIPLDHLKMAYAQFHGVENWRKVKKSEVGDWITLLAKADIETDIDKAINKFIYP